MYNNVIEFINSNTAYRKILKEVIKKYKIYGKITGNFTIKAENELEKQAIRNFDINILNNEYGKIKSKEVERLFSQKYPSIDFISLLETIEGNKLRRNIDIKAENSMLMEKFFIDILGYVALGKGKEWFENVIDKREYGYKIIVNKYNEVRTENILLDRLKADIKIIIDAINNLPYIYGNYENLSVFSARISKDSHYFDSGIWTGNLLIKGVSYILGLEEPNNIEDLNELYFKVGLFKDVVSNHTTIYGLKAYIENKLSKGEYNEVKAVNAFIEWGEPLQISLSNLLKIDFLEPISEEIYIFENPAVVAELISKGVNNKSLICTSGQLNLSSHMLLNKLKGYKKIYYAGDFDIRGIEIAFKLKEKLKDKLEFLLYKKEYYFRIKGNNEIDHSKIKQLEKYKIPDLIEIIESLEKEKKVGYQELLIEDYIEVMNQK